MRDVKLLISIAAFVLASCQQPSPDFVFSTSPPKGGHKVVFRGFQPRGTIDGYISVTFDDDEQQSMVISHIENGEVGWRDKNTIVIVAKKISFANLDNPTYPGGSFDRLVNIVVCAKDVLECSFADNSDMILIRPKYLSNFPE